MAVELTSSPASSSSSSSYASPSSSAIAAGNGEGRTVKECQDMIRKALRIPMVKFLRENMEKAGCNFGDIFINAVHCDKLTSGGYTRGGGIMVCSNHMNIQDGVNQVVIHHLIHAYDDYRAANLDWTNCAHHACSEIRAGHLSGDCHYKRELLRGYVKMRGHEQLPGMPWKLSGMFVTMTQSPLTGLLEIG